MRGLPIVDCGFQRNCRLPIADFQSRFPIEFALDNRQSAIGNWKSAIGNQVAVIAHHK